MDIDTIVSKCFDLNQFHSELVFHVLDCSRILSCLEDLAKELKRDPEEAMWLGQTAFDGLNATIDSIRSLVVDNTRPPSGLSNALTRLGPSFGAIAAAAAAAAAESSTLNQPTLLGTSPSRMPHVPPPLVDPFVSIMRQITVDLLNFILLFAEGGKPLPPACGRLADRLTRMQFTSDPLFLQAMGGIEQFRARLTTAVQGMVAAGALTVSRSCPHSGLDHKFRRSFLEALDVFIVAGVTPEVVISSLDRALSDLCQTPGAALDRWAPFFGTLGDLSKQIDLLRRVGLRDLGRELVIPVVSKEIAEGTLDVARVTRHASEIVAFLRKLLSIRAKKRTAVIRELQRDLRARFLEREVSTMESAAELLNFATEAVVRAANGEAAGAAGAEDRDHALGQQGGDREPAAVGGGETEAA